MGMEMEMGMGIIIVFSRVYKAMGFLFSKLWSRLFAYDEFKICIIGLSNAGKTTTLVW